MRKWFDRDSLLRVVGGDVLEYEGGRERSLVLKPNILCVSRSKHPDKVNETLLTSS
jgi:hypothetical protein